MSDADLESRRALVKKLLSDPLAQFLIDRSLLTRTQVETLLIELMAEEEGNYDAKAIIRGVSRGSFKRTLQQAARKVLGSIYTIILMAYLGALSGISALLEIGRSIEEYREMVENGIDPELRNEIINALKDSLEKFEEFWKM